MTYRPNAPQPQAGDFYANLFVQGCGLHAFKPATKDITVIRFLPEIRDGAPLPMMVGQDASGPMISGVHAEQILTLTGEAVKWTGFARCSDMPDADDFTAPWSSLFVELRRKLKDRGLDPGYEQYLRRACDGRDAPVKKPSDCLLVQGIVISVNGKQDPALLNRPTAIILTPSAVASFNQVVNEAIKHGIDLFDYDKGYTLTVSGVKTQRAADDFLLTPGTLAPCPPEFRGRWIPWEQAIKLRTYDEHIRQMAMCYGPQLVAERPALLQALNRLGIAVPARAGVVSPAQQFQPQQQFGQPAAAPQQFNQPTAQPQVQFGQPAAAPAPAGFGTPAAPAGFAAPTAAAPSGFGTPATTPGFGTPTAAAPSGFGTPAATPGFGTPAAAPAFAAPTAAAPAGFGTPAAAPAPGFGQPAAPQPQFGQPPAAATPVGGPAPGSLPTVGAPPSVQVLTDAYTKLLDVNAPAKT